jgi:hypothetical protein
MNLNDLLVLNGINPEKVMVFRHRPVEPVLRKVLPWLALERPEIFNAYQQCHGEKVEKALQKADYIASFTAHGAGKALFAGLFRRGKWSALTYAQFWSVAENKDLGVLGMIGPSQERKSILRFELDPVDFYSDWVGRLIVDWPGLERSWWRWANRNKINVEAILEHKGVDREMPSWENLVLTWHELNVLPNAWKIALSQWRGVYFICDKVDGKGYVGSAYGAENILGRWLNYAASGHGGNKLLKNRDPSTFVFSILELAKPSATSEEVIYLEENWKKRLHTRDVGMNEN